MNGSSFFPVSFLVPILLKTMNLATSPEDIAVVKEKLLAAGYGVYDTVLGGAGVTVHHRRQ